MSMGNRVHLMCADCIGLDRCEVPRIPTAVTFAEPLPAPCCYCGNTTSTGVFYSDDPQDLRCKGEGPVHEEESA